MGKGDFAKKNTGLYLLEARPMLRVRPTPTGPRQHSSLPSRLIALAAAGPSSPPADFAAATVAAAAHFLLLLPSALCTVPPVLALRHRRRLLHREHRETLSPPSVVERSSSADCPPRREKTPGPPVWLCPQTYGFPPAVAFTDQSIPLPPARSHGGGKLLFFPYLISRGTIKWSIRLF